MTPDELDAIRARDAAYGGHAVLVYGYGPHDWRDSWGSDPAVADRRALLAEVDRLTALRTATLEVLSDDAAMALERARIRAAVEGLPFGGDSEGEYVLGWEDAKAHVLAAIDGEHA